MTEAIIQPEMKAKIIDESHFRFHVELKAKIINAADQLRQGKDFLTALSRFRFKTDPRWTEKARDDPNIKILLETLDEYKALEHRPNRAKILVPLLEYAIGLIANDLYFRERGEWFLYRLLSRAGDFRLNECFCNPDYWYPKGRSPVAPDVKPIEQEYRDWYGIDPLNDNLDDIPEDLKERIIAENIEWMKANRNTELKLVLVPVKKVK